MNIAEFKNEFLIGYDKITNYDAPGYTDEEISVFLTQSQERFIKTRYNALGNKYKKGFEQTEKRRKELNELIKDYTKSITNLPFTIPAVGETHIDGKLVQLPEDFMWAIEEEVEDLENTECANRKRIRVKPTTHDEYSINIHNPFKKPSSGLFWRMEHDRTVLDYITPGTPKPTVEIITDGIQWFKYHLRYIKLPNPIIVANIAPQTVDGISTPTECELNIQTHREIVDGAIAIALENTEQKRLQSKIAIDTANE